MDHLAENNDTRKIENEKIFLIRLTKLKWNFQLKTIFNFFEHENAKKKIQLF
jgi:hypothetical protein